MELLTLVKNEFSLPKGLLLEDLELVKNSIIAFIQRYILVSNSNGVVIGLSGGVDSTVVAAIASEALGSDRVLGIVTPFTNVSKETDVVDALAFAEKIGIECKVFYIDNLLKPFQELQLDRLTLGNISARLRMIIWYYYSNRNNLLVLGGGNKSELLTGFYTKYGDAGVDLLPIGDLYKTNVWQVAKYMKIPKNIIDKVPTPGLWINQTDESELGCSYSTLDTILFLANEMKFNIQQITKYGIEEQIIVKILERVSKNVHKRKPIPIPNIRKIWDLST